MLTITKKQMQIVQKLPEDTEHIPVLCQHLKQNHGLCINQLSDDALTEQVRQAVDIARAYGLQSQRDIYGFVTLELTQCSGFHQHRKVQQLLRSTDANPNRRMLWLVEKLPGYIWAEVSQCHQ